MADRQIGKVIAWQPDAMRVRDIKSKQKPPDEPHDPLGWIAIIFAAVLAFVLVIQTSPAVRGTPDGQQIEAKAG